MTTTIKNYNLSKLTGLTDSNNTLSNISINNSIIIPKSAENTNTNSDNTNAGFYIKDVNSNGSGDFYNIKVNSEPSSIPALYFNNNEVLDRTNVLSTLESILEDYTLDTSNLMVTNGYINFANGSTPNTNQGNAGVGIRYSSANTVQFKNYDTNWIDLVDIINHDEFKELVDVDVTTNPLLDNQYITYNSGTAKFVNSNLSISHDANPTLSGDLTIGDYLLQFGDTYNRLVYNSEGIIDNNLIVLKNNSTLTNNYSYLEINNADIDGIVNPSIIVKSTYTDSNVGIEITTLNAGDIYLNATTGNVNVNATHLVVSGDLTVQGTTTTIESIITVYKDPVIQLGGSNVLVSNDGKDRGVSFKYYDGGDKTGFMGYDNDTGNFILKKNATIINDVVVSGTDAGITFGALTSTGDLDVTGTITGDTSLTLDTTTITTAEIGVLDGVTPGTATASKALVLDASKDIGTIRNLTIDGIFTDGNYTFDTSGNVSGLGTVGCGAITSSGTLDVIGDTSVSTFDSTGATSLATGGGVVNIASSGLMTTVKGTLNVDEAVTLDTTLDVTGDTSVSTFDSTGATSLATGGGVVDIASTGVMTTIKGTLNVDEAVTFDTTLDVTGDTSVSTFDSTGATSLATGGGVVNIASAGLMTTIKGTLNVDEAVTLDTTLDVTGDTSVSTFDSTGSTSLATGGGVVNIASTGVLTTVKGTLNVDEAVTLDTTLDVTGDTSVSTFDSTGATSLATGGGVVDIASTGVMTTVKGTLNVDEAVTFDTTLDVTGDTSVSTFDSTGATSLATGGGVVDIASTGVMTTIKGTLNVDEAVTLDTTLDIVSDLTLTDGAVSITDADNDTSLSLINNTITTADALVDISSTSLTTGAMMRINANTAAHDGEILELINAGDATSTGTGLSITMPDITTGAATGINVTMVGATTTAKGISVTMDAITTGDMLYLDNGGATMTGDGKFINCNDDDVSQFSVGAKGLTTITGDASGTDALVITAGDILVSSGHIDMTVGDMTLADGSLSITDADNDASLSVTNNTITTNNLIDVNTSSLTTGNVMNIDATSTSFTGPIMNITTASTNANNITRWEPVYKNINNFIKGNLKFSWQTDTGATEVDTGLDLPYTTGVCIIKNIYIITTTTDGSAELDIGLLSSETNGDADGFLDGVAQSTEGIRDVFTNAEKGAFSEDSGNLVITRWKLPFNSSTAQTRSISITLSGTGSAGTVIMEYMAYDL